MTSLTGLTRAEMEALVARMGEPPYRARQIFTWVQARGARDYDAMTDIPKALRERLAEIAPVRSARILERHRSADGTCKLLLGLRDDQRVECVLIPEEERATACISTQVGCGVGCLFCASGADGVVRNLDCAEIVEQVQLLRAEAGSSILSNIVVMGMGEPLHNVASLAKALRLIQDPEGFDMGARRITLSTSGPKEGFEALLREGLKVKLAISLHAARDEVRRKLVPRGGTGSVAELKEMARRWFEATGRDVTYEYVLLSGINDSDEDARALAEVCGKNRNLNLIPMNPVSFAHELRAPSNAGIDRFAGMLRNKGVIVHLRRQRGDDVAAACGQLRLNRET
ncbi:MAG: dual-specificity RNA methyltransferase RlmN [Planctomycetota bacterium]